MTRYFQLAIPTPVGNARRVRGSPRGSPGHPHACGERAVIEATPAPNIGPSPRLWGTQTGKGSLYLRGRAIPTPVGNAGSSSARAWRRAGHPHACGERTVAVRAASAVYGPSPRLWGTRLPARPEQVRRRAIPTPVGNATCQPWPSTTPSGHPHACGERATDGIPVRYTPGPSPRLWGTRNLAYVGHVVPRAIPTPVGNAGHPRPGASAASGHPHACGERLCRATPARVRNGPSPRLWGTPAGCRPDHHRSRAIPTPVGNAGHPRPGASAASGHPHACGERTGVGRLRASMAGPSPRLWGTPGVQEVRGVGHRAIPTPVGNASGGRSGVPG